MASDSGVIRGLDGKDRCYWCDASADYRAYHDGEWGRPVADDVYLFEKICLDGFQSGLSWLTILRKRENFRRAFAGFDFHKVARFKDADVERLRDRLPCERVDRPTGKADGHPPVDAAVRLDAVRQSSCPHAVHSALPLPGPIFPSRRNGAPTSYRRFCRRVKHAELRRKICLTHSFSAPTTRGCVFPGVGPERSL